MQPNERDWFIRNFCQARMFIGSGYRNYLSSIGARAEWKRWSYGPFVDLRGLENWINGIHRVIYSSAIHEERLVLRIY